MPLQTRIENGKKYAKLSDLQPWELNPRIHDEEALLRRKIQVARYGQFRDVFVNADGKAIGGNRTLKAMKSLNENLFRWSDDKGVEQEVDRRGQFDEVKITELGVGEQEVDGVKKYYAILDGKPETTLFDSIEQLFVEYNLVDNDPGEWDKKALHSLIKKHIKLMPMPAFKLQVAPSIPLKTFIAKEEKAQTNPVKSKEVVLQARFTPDRYAEFEPKLQKVRQAYSAENLTDLFVTLVEEAETFIEEKAKQTPNT